MTNVTEATNSTADDDVTGENVRVSHPLITLQVRQPAEPSELPNDTCDGEIDDLGVTKPDLFRLERMSDTHIWSAVHLPEGKRLVLHLFVEDGRLRVTDWIE